MKAMRIGAVSFALVIAAETLSAAEVKRVAPGPGYVCREYVLGEIRPTGFLAEFARRQANGTTGNRMKLGYPFDQSMWEVAITNLHYADPVWRGQDRPYSEGEKKWPWPPYEQTAYMLDAMLRLSYLTDCPDIRADYLRSLDAVLANPTPEGKLGGVCPCFPGWPMAIFARSAYARFVATGDRRILDAFVKHYNSFGDERRKWSGRSDYNIESMLAFNEYVGDPKVVEDSVACFEKSFMCKMFRDHECIEGHGPTLSEALKLPAVLFLHTGDRKWIELGLRAIDKVFERHEQPDGLISANEGTSGRDPNQGHEACVVADMLWSLGYYLQANPRAIDGDRMERIVYNALPGHSSKDFKRHQYMSFVNQAQATPFSKCTHFAPRSKHMQYRHQLFFECCLGNIQRAFPAFALRMWLKDEKTGEPISMLHGPSKLSSSFNGVDYTFEEVTDYPFDETVKYVFHAAAPIEMTLTYRVPSWAKRADAGTLVRVHRTWKDGDEFVTSFPSEVIFKTEKNWHWFTKGALTFAWPVPTHIVEENPGDDFSPLILTPSAPWNWALDPAQIEANLPKAVYRPNGKYPFDEPPLTLEVPAYGLQEWRVFDCNKWMPDVPLFAHKSGEKAILKLVPYGATMARVTAFPDVTPRKELMVPVAYLYDGQAYDYKSSQPLAEQKFGPEIDAEYNWNFLKQDDPPQRDPDDYYNLGAHFCTYRNKLAYLVFRIWSDEDGEATFVLGAAHQYQAFLEGKEVAHSVGIRDARWLAPDWFKAPVKKGYNYLTVKVAAPASWGNMRRDWGAKLQVFMEK